MTLTPWRLFHVALVGWMNRQQQEVIQYLRIENQILRETLGKNRLILNESQKARLATAAVKLGKDLLRKWRTMFHPDTLLRWQCVRRRLEQPRASQVDGQPDHNLDGQQNKIRSAHRSLGRG